MNKRVLLTTCRMFMIFALLVCSLQVDAKTKQFALSGNCYVQIEAGELEKYEAVKIVVTEDHGRIVAPFRILGYNQGRVRGDHLISCVGLNASELRSIDSSMPKAFDSRIPSDCEVVIDSIFHLIIQCLEFGYFIHSFNAVEFGFGDCHEVFTGNIGMPGQKLVSYFKQTWRMSAKGSNCSLCMFGSSYSGTNDEYVVKFTIMQRGNTYEELARGKVSGVFSNSVFTKTITFEHHTPGLIIAIEEMPNEMKPTDNEGMLSMSTMIQIKVSCNGESNNAFVIIRKDLGS